jgi:hypothetical protein
MALAQVCTIEVCDVARDLKTSVKSARLLGSHDDEVESMSSTTRFPSQATKGALCPYPVCDLDCCSKDEDEMEWVWNFVHVSRPEYIAD